MLSNWRNRPRPIEKSVEQGSWYNRPYMRAPALSTGFFFFVLS